MRGWWVTINGSPYHAGKLRERERMVAGLASRHGVHMAYLNLVGGQDELVFDGASMVFGPDGRLIIRGSQFEEELVAVDLHLGGSSTAERPPLPERSVSEFDEAGEVYAALVLGTRDYVRKCGFSRVLVALSGGIDSSLVATVAADALGAENVTTVFMPSRFSSEQSLIDARAMSENLGIEMRTIPIEEPFSAYLDVLAEDFQGTEWGVAEENTQSRIRGNLIMALSNKLDMLVLTTGNKSEMATGYATIYGDMAGGFAVIKDVPKTMVYQLAEHRNRMGPAAVIPQSVIDKAPTAELRPDQKDEDSLPPYEVLDPILKAYVEEDMGLDEIVALGFDEETVRHAIGLVDRSEYKRRQAPPGIKITPRNFGRDRRMPIAGGVCYCGDGGLSMKIGVTFPQTEIGSDPAAVLDYAQAAEGLGFSHLIVFDHVLGANAANRPGWSGAYQHTDSFYEPFALFGYLAGVTRRLELVTAVIILPQRQTALVAKQAATVDVLSGGRLRLGVGIGWNDVEYEALGENFHDRGRRSEEQIEVMRALWTNELVTYEGRWHRITDAGINPLPVQRPIPVWLGGGADPVLRRVARMADGWFPQVRPR